MEATPIRVAIIGGGCAGISTAFELSRPEHRGKYEVTVYQAGWRLGGKGASGRGPAARIEEHGLHLWMGFYENAFRLLRECYGELDRDPKKCRIADWRDAFVPEPFIGVVDTRDGKTASPWTAFFPPGDGLPGDPLSDQNPFTITGYLIRSATLLQALFQALRGSSNDAGQPDHTGRGGSTSTGGQRSRMPLDNLINYGLFATTVGLIQGASLLEILLRGTLPNMSSALLPLIEALSFYARRQFEAVISEAGAEMRRLWEITDLLLAFQTGVIRSGLLTDPRGFDAINDYDTREWLLLHGASERSVNCPLMRGLYDLALAYEDGDFRRPRMAAGLGLRGCLRMFFTYRGAMLWKMQSGMGDVVFAPFYEVLKRRGVAFRFFHRLRKVGLSKVSPHEAGERRFVETLQFDLQAAVRGGVEYQPLIDVDGLPCWLSKPDYSQLIDGARLEKEGRAFESFWDNRKVETRILKVEEHFDCVVLAVGLGAIPSVCGEIIASNDRWRSMLARVKTVATQAFQIWMREDMESLGWNNPPTTLSGFTQPFDTWADMRQLIADERWPEENTPRAIAYFCSVLPDSPNEPGHASDFSYPESRRKEVRDNAVRFLNEEIVKLWPAASANAHCFRWDLLVDPSEKRFSRKSADDARFDSQFWTANVNPSDRYTLSLPGSAKYRISPLDNTYDNLTVAGDWTSCGLNQGCVEAAVISGRLAANAISSLPALEDIVGYDHP
jgi:uncharacterized protein with NAD-binding domain and iron-sulfur cluster